MATEILNINGSDSGWPIGFVTNIDEPVTAPDGSAVATVTESGVLVLDLDNVTNIDDNDTVNSVTIKVRCSYSDFEFPVESTGGVDVELLIGGSSQGTTSTGALTASMSTKTTVNAGWDSDWTASQLNGAQVRLTAVILTGSTLNPLWSLDCIDVEVDYTVNPAISIVVPEVDATLTGKDLTKQGSEEVPDRVPLNLMTAAPTLAFGVVTPDKSALLTGQISFINATIEILNPNDWDSGWPIGFVSNIDEPVATPDGQTIGTTLNGDIVVIDFSPTTVTNTDDVAAVTVTVRANRIDDDPFVEPGDGSLSVELLVDGTPRGSDSLALQHNNFTNTTLTNSGWNQDWTQDQLNGIQLRVTAGVNLCTAYIDAINLSIEYTPQSPVFALPAKASGNLSTHTPITLVNHVSQPAVKLLVLDEQTLVATTALFPNVDPDLLQLNGVAPATVVNHIVQPTIYAAALAGKVPQDIEASNVAPSVRTLVLAGEIPTLDFEDNHWIDVGKKPLILQGQVVALPAPDNPYIDITKTAMALAGKVPTATEGVNYEIRIGVPPFFTPTELTFAAGSPTVNVGQRTAPAEDTLTLSTAAPTWFTKGFISVPAGSLTITTSVIEAVFPYVRLMLQSYAPTLLLEHYRRPGAATFTLDTYDTIVENGSIATVTGSIALSTAAPTVVLSSQLGKEEHRLISLTVDYDIEFVATPVEEITEN